jgi:hypothetical protein
MQSVRNRGYGRRLAALLAAGSLVLGVAATAGADTVYNTLGTINIDDTLEVINMTYPTGAPVMTSLKVQVVDSDGQHGCNLQGNPFDLTMSATTTTAGVVTVSFPHGSRFENCSSVVDVLVTPTGVGSTEVRFTGTPSYPPGVDSHGSFSTLEANFRVNVTASVSNPPPVACDADPAAPAWANAILRANPVYKNRTDNKNIISAVARQMDPEAVFGTYPKNNHHGYEQAVYDFMKYDLGLKLADPGDWSGIVRPDWSCSNQTS